MPIALSVPLTSGRFDEQAEPEAGQDGLYGDGGRGFHRGGPGPGAFRHGPRK